MRTIFEFDEDGYPLNIIWKDNNLFVGSTVGETLHLRNVVKGKTDDVLNSLFISDAEEEEEEEEREVGRKNWAWKKTKVMILMHC